MTSPSHPPTTRALAAHAVVLLSAQWAGPSGPAPTVLKELSRRWGTSVHAVLVEDPDDELLELWDVDMLPTWLRFTPGEPLDDEETLTVTHLRGASPGGEGLHLEGPWTLTHRRSGALPKHVVETEFGPRL